MKKTSIFIVPRVSTAWRGNEAGWITSSGWASAGQQVWGEALVTTPDGIFTPQESILFPRGSKSNVVSPQRKNPIRKLIPEFLITGYKDIKLVQSKPNVWPIEKIDLVKDKKVMLVWERHDLFAGPGRKLADRLGVPFVKSAEATVVWEARKWGVNRPVWGYWLEKGEADSLKQADLVSCVSDEVRDQVIHMGVSPEKVIVSPNRVDSSIFHPTVNGSHVREQYTLQNKRVLGWTGSFRAFHGLDSVILAFKKVHQRHPDTVLMLVGDGLELQPMKELVLQHGLMDHVIFPGRQPFTSIPGFVVNFHIALVSANSAEGFHYSPLKLREYLAAGKPVIAPLAGNLPELFTDGSDLVFYEAGNSNDLADKMNLLLENSSLHTSLKANAIALFKKEGTWVHELKKVCDRLGIPY